MLLDLADERQSDTFDCGAAAVRTVLKFHHVIASPPPACPIDGTDVRLIEAHLRERCGLQVISGSFDLTDLAHFCDTHRPPIVLLTEKGESCSHYVCVRGISRGRVYYQCPTEGRLSLRVPDFLAAWRATDGRLTRPLLRWSVIAWPASVSTLPLP